MLQDFIESGIHFVVSDAAERVARLATSAEEAGGIPLIMLDLEMRLMQANRDWFAGKVAEDTVNA